MNNSNGSHPDSNGHGNNGKTAVSTQGATSLATSSLDVSPTLKRFDQPVVLRQSSILPRAVVWTLIGMTTAGVIWASVAQFEEAIPAQGKLEPEGAVTEVQAPVAGVAKRILVKDGQQVKQGDLLLALDPTVDNAEQTSLQKIRAALMAENQYYQMQMTGKTPANSKLLASLPAEQAFLTKHRAELAAENQLYRLQLQGAGTGAPLTPEQQQRLQSAQSEVRSRISAAKLEVDQLQKQLKQTQVQLVSAKELLAVEKTILADLTVLANEGGIARNQYYKQQQQFVSRQAEVDRLLEEEKRLQYAITQADEKVNNAIALSQNELLTKIADNQKRIAEIDSQLTKAIVDNEQQIAQIDSQISKTQQNLRYQELKAPVSGTVFDLQARNPGYVTNSSAPILKIVPNQSLVAKVFITNRDIGFVKEGMNVDVRIDSFPYSEFGDVKGKLVWVGSDALPPDNIYPFYRFPAKVVLERQYLMISDRQVNLQSGMSVSTNIKLRKRNVASIFTDLFTKKMESLKFVR
ncbi:HlyD family efflux transporter periplasmic adaptor subunit [Fischerella sp. JS2]|uniref:HlyD family efflux transporter periplasmic adaptor subunit n=1 Tax=Fischerella sp. JS2 TaxID=2597771 RepID=UPI0028E2D43D|nr:HlyD family efflux transporter periplasmic adaptor subunit [Fischerella sp. JS2]